MSFVKMPRKYPHKPVHGARKTKKKKPEWDDTVNDLSVHRASAEELVRRKLVAQSHNLDVVKDDQLRRKISSAKSPDTRKKPAQNAFLKEILYDNAQLHDALVRSDRMMAVVKDLFGDQPMKYQGAPNVTLAPEHTSVNGLPNPDLGPSKLDLLSESLMDRTALNTDDEPEAEEGALYEPAGDLARFKRLLTEHENEAGAAMTVWRRVRAGEEREPLWVHYEPAVDLARFKRLLAEHENEAGAAMTVGRRVRAGEEPLTRSTADSLLHELATKLGLGSEEGSDADSSRTASPNPPHDGAMNDTARVRRTRSRVRADREVERRGAEGRGRELQPSATPTNSSPDLSDLNQILAELESHVTEYERLVTGSGGGGSVGGASESLSGFTYRLVSAVCRLTRQMKQTAASLRVEQVLQEQLQQDAAFFRQLVDTLTNDILITQEQHATLQAEFEHYKNQTSGELAILKRSLESAGIELQHSTVAPVPRYPPHTAGGHPQAHVCHPQATVSHPLAVPTDQYTQSQPTTHQAYTQGLQESQQSRSQDLPSQHHGHTQGQGLAHHGHQQTQGHKSNGYPSAVAATSRVQTGPVGPTMSQASLAAVSASQGMTASLRNGFSAQGGGQASFTAAQQGTQESQGQTHTLQWWSQQLGQRSAGGHSDSSLEQQLAELHQLQKSYVALQQSYSSSNTSLHSPLPTPPTPCIDAPAFTNGFTHSNGAPVLSLSSAQSGSVDQGQRNAQMSKSSAHSNVSAMQSLPSNAHGMQRLPGNAHGMQMSLLCTGIRGNVTSNGANNVSNTVYSSTAGGGPPVSVDAWRGGATSQAPVSVQQAWPLTMPIQSQSPVLPGDRRAASGSRPLGKLQIPHCPPQSAEPTFAASRVPTGPEGVGRGVGGAAPIAGRTPGVAGGMGEWSGAEVLTADENEASSLEESLRTLQQVIDAEDGSLKDQIAQLQRQHAEAQSKLQLLMSSVSQPPIPLQLSQPAVSRDAVSPPISPISVVSERHVGCHVGSQSAHAQQEHEIRASDWGGSAPREIRVSVPNADESALSAADSYSRL